MKNLVIIGAGGFGREIFCSARESIGYEEDFVIKGFIDDNIHVLDDFNNYAPMLGTIADYQPEENDVFVSAIGTVPTRKKVSEIIMIRGGDLYTLIHKTAYISQNVTIGKGCMILAGVRIHCDATIGDYVVMQPNAIIGHDVNIGKWSLINAMADCGGMSKIGECVTIHTSAFVLPLGVVEDGATVGAGSVAMRKVKAGQTVFGVPAKPVITPEMMKE